ncbi:acyclic terpene utilization AtuA family protein [Pseudonocardia sp. RS010]|uniref:acyclic terpene utilization AtuA family protein n=1 Tax=Pseudonocardia sp. RS010 TaxID=3385979 RepID=UPI0039A325B9
MRDPIRIGNCSGFYGDRISAAREMVEGGPIDVLCGDYLAELTMLILAKAQAKDPAGGYARTFLTQMEQVLGTCADRGIKVVANAGGLNPAGLAAALREMAQRLGVPVRVAHVEGDDLRGDLAAITPPVGEAKPVSANAYLGGWGIAEALGAGADVVVTGRVTDASLVVGPAAWWHGWARTDWDRLAGAVAAGHVIECGPQATGGNYAFLDEVTDRRYPGFPIAEVAADGSSVITKHEGTGGLVSVGTVTAQLLYEIAEPAYLGPDVVAHFDTIALRQQAEHRVEISGVTGSPPPETLKVALNDVGGFRNTMTMVLTGLDVEAKAAFAEQQLFDVLGGRDRFAEVDVRLLRFDSPDAPTNEQATAHLRVTVKDSDPRKVGRAFSSGIMEVALAGYAGFHTTTPPTSESAYGVYRPAAVPRSSVTQLLVLPDGEQRVIADPPTAPVPAGAAAPAAETAAPAGPTRRAPLGAVLGARSGDKGGNANIGLWARDDAGYAWARAHLTVDRLRGLLGPEVSDLRIERFELPNIRALNVVVHGLLGEGVASSTRPDAQAKGLGEYLRSRLVDVPDSLLTGN